MPVFSEGLRPDEFAVLTLGAVQARVRDTDASVDVEVRNEGADPVADVVVAVLAEARVAASATVAVRPGEAARATLSWPWRGGPEHVTVVVDPDQLLTMEPRTACTRTVSMDRTPAAAAAAPSRWVSLGPALIRSGLGATGRLHHIVIRPDRPATMLVAGGGGSGSGVWRTEDAGATWAPVTDAFGTPDVKALAMDPADPARVYAATTDGLLVTTNGGTSWSRVAGNDALGMTGADGALVVDPADPVRLYLANARGVSRSVDRGRTWAVVHAAGQGTDLITGGPAGRLLAAVRNDGDLAQTGVWASSDSGDSWRRLTGCPGGRLPAITGPTGIRLARSGSTIFASFKTGTGWTLYRTTGVGCSIGGRPESVWERGWRPEGTAGGEPIFRRLWKYLCADPADPDSSIWAAPTCGYPPTVATPSPGSPSRMWITRVSRCTPPSPGRSSRSPTAASTARPSVAPRVPGSFSARASATPSCTTSRTPPPTRIC
ncbi:MAG TPA: CARDB domain-containing protein [Actinoplanes sp.]|nr:CARDB domain-containing protein [Actinoplanes sp.]